MHTKALLITGGALAALLASSIGAHAGDVPRSTIVYEWGTTIPGSGLSDAPRSVQNFGIQLTQIDAGNRSDLAVLSDGSVWVWGADNVGPKSMTAIQVPGLSNVSQRPVDGNHDFAVIEQPGTDAYTQANCPGDSEVLTWGLNQSGDLGIGVPKGETVYSTPQVLTALDCRNVVQLAAAAQHMVALTQSGQVYVWGSNGSDVLGMSGKEQPSPVLNAAATALTGGTAAGVEITAGSSAGGMLVNGQAYSWGNNVQGECGCGSTAPSISTPTAVSQDGVLYTAIDQGGDTGSNGHELALDASGNVYAWGDNNMGQLGQLAAMQQSDIPLQVLGLPVITDVRAGGLHSLALDADGNVWAWGEGTYGQLGDGSRSNAYQPVDVLGGVTQISAGSLHSLAA